MAKETTARSKLFDDEQIAQIRADRAVSNDAGKPAYSHAALAKKYGTTAGVISQIVRNRSYKNENYVPTHDGN